MEIHAAKKTRPVGWTRFDYRSGTGPRDTSLLFFFQIRYLFLKTAIERTDSITGSKVSIRRRQIWTNRSM